MTVSTWTGATTRWEYCQRVCGFLVGSDWDKLGNEGWELVSVNKGVAYFKRLKPWPYTLSAVTNGVYTGNANDTEG